MNIVLLSGGSGKRLWPLSNAVRSKQFIKFLRGEGDQYESMVQRVYHQIHSVDPNANITVTTSRAQKSVVSNQLGNQVSLCLEPSRRDTFAAIALSVVSLVDRGGLTPEDVIIFCPIDPYVGESYFRTLLSLEEAAKADTANITLLGVAPTYPSEKYGYVLPAEEKGYVRPVKGFFEKPSEEQAKEYIAKGALWNCGVFALKAKYLLNLLATMVPYTTYQELYEHYTELPKISFDYAVVEKEPSIQCITYHGEWKDIGTWNTLSEEMEPHAIGYVVVGPDCENVNVINELKIPVLVAGLRDTIVAAAPDGILISSKESSSFIKPYVDTIDQRIMYKEKAWGEMKIINEEASALTIILHMTAGRYMSVHRHEQRDECWLVQEGYGVILVGDERHQVSPGSVVHIPRGQWHTVYAQSEMSILETQLGIVEDEDIIRAPIQENWWQQA